MPEPSAITYVAATGELGSGDLADQKHAEARATTVRLVKETGITQAQANDLVDILGLGWSSLIREARLLKSAR